MTKLKHDSLLIAIIWFENNYMKLNEEKCHLIVSGHKYEHIWAKIGNSIIWEERIIKLLCINIDSKLTFHQHVSIICDKAGRKLTVLTRLMKILSFQQRRILMKSFIDAQFNYGPLVWMFYSRTLNSKLNRLQERALRIVYQDDISPFEMLLNKENSVTIHQRNLQRLAITMYKINNNLSPKITQNLFTNNTQNYNLRSNTQFKVAVPKTVRDGTETFSYIGPKIWELIPNDLKNLPTLKMFKKNIKTWFPDKCP